VNELQENDSSAAKRITAACSHGEVEIARPRRREQLTSNAQRHGNTRDQDIVISRSTSSKPLFSLFSLFSSPLSRDGADLVDLVGVDGDVVLARAPRCAKHNKSQNRAKIRINKKSLLSGVPLAGTLAVLARVAVVDGRVAHAGWREAVFWRRRRGAGVRAEQRREEEKASSPLRLRKIRARVGAVDQTHLPGASLIDRAFTGFHGTAFPETPSLLCSRDRVEQNGLG